MNERCGSGAREVGGLGLGAEPQEREPHLLGEVRGRDAVEILAHVGDNAVDRLLDPAGSERDTQQGVAVAFDLDDAVVVERSEFLLQGCCDLFVVEGEQAALPDAEVQVDCAGFCLEVECGVHHTLGRAGESSVVMNGDDFDGELGERAEIGWRATAKARLPKGSPWRTPCEDMIWAESAPAEPRRKSLACLE